MRLDTLQDIRCSNISQYNRLARGGVIWCLPDDSGGRCVCRAAAAAAPWLAPPHSTELGVLSCHVTTRRPSAEPPLVNVTANTCSGHVGRAPIELALSGYCFH
ncbi:hypothetical protein JYU34_002585 [Plutella xylostella]|uniref:Uncharacterized protein n=1 Tax=Plutella xylostella TaxID=51655 RepID=A0ABQ7R2N8_PLUXY|nr:hypothetical protein JYU34_002585 [Plutella xylostella]